MRYTYELHCGSLNQINLCLAVQACHHFGLTCVLILLIDEFPLKNRSKYYQMRSFLFRSRLHTLLCCEHSEKKIIFSVGQHLLTCSKTDLIVF